MNPKGIILSGGPNSVYEDDAFTIDPEIYHLGVPVLGICYGMQLTTKILGGRVERANQREYGKAMIKAKSDELFFGLPEEQTVWMSHSDKVIEIPEGFEVIADSPSTQYAAIEDKSVASMVCNSTQKSVILSMVMTFYVTSCAVFANVQANGQWKTLSISKSKNPRKKLAIVASFVQ